MICLALFHFANAPLLLPVGQKIAPAHKEWASAAMSAGNVAAKLAMLPVALLCGAKAGSWGRRPLRLAGFAILHVRAVLYMLSDNSFWLVFVQMMDGVAAALARVVLWAVAPESATSDG